MSSFIAIDYETANSSYESVCAIGATVVLDGKITSNIYSLINFDVSIPDFLVSCNK